MAEGMTATMESILLVDDQPSNLQTLFQTLEGVGCRLLVAKNGEAALTIAQKARPDLILLDVMMPGIDGFEVCRRLKENPATEKTPIIFLSALDETADKVRGLELGAVDYITKPFQPEEVIARANNQLTIHRLGREVQKQRDELEHELQVVSRLQRDLLPQSLPHLPGLRLAAHYETSRYAGGDYYDFAELSDGQLGILTADAAGHSAPAAILMAMTCTLFRSCTTRRGEPDHVLAFINENLCRVNKESFVTAVYGVIDPRRSTLKIARAAHPLPLLYRSSEKNACEIACAGVFAMGWESYEEIPVTEIEISAGDRLLFYTDGVTEQFNEQQEIYGTDRLLKQFEAAGTDAPETILAGIVEDLGRFAGGRPTDDDQAILVVAVE